MQPSPKFFCPNKHGLTYQPPDPNPNKYRSCDLCSQPDS
jgi:hypothetical protein